MKNINIIIILLFLSVSSSLLADDFSDYWYAGKAELASYELSQSRYGTARRGYAVGIWVTEDFSTKKHVKLDRPSAVDESQKTKVLKVNLIKRFQTGVYDYSTMNSTFQPVDLKKYPYPLKTTLSMQDWCGQTFVQLDAFEDKLEIQSKSYFESQGDRNISLPLSFEEDQVWTQIRLAPGSLPIGKIRALPSLSYLFLEHKKIKLTDAVATLEIAKSEQFPNRELYSYTLDFPAISRKSTWLFEKGLSHRILQFKEKYQNSSQKEVRNMMSLIKAIHEPYWAHSSVMDSRMRSRLGLVGVPIVQK